MSIEGLGPDNVANGSFVGGGYAFFHLPGESGFTYVAQRGLPETFGDMADAYGREGFAVAPFAQVPATPKVLIRPDFAETFPLPSAESDNPAAPHTVCDADAQRTYYRKAFAECRNRLQNGRLRKVVLSRRLTLAFPAGTPSPASLFFKACRLHPHNYVSTWWTRQTGAWLVATPETLLSHDAQNGQPAWRTMALAGTMPWEGRLLPYAAWSAKNREEQAFVTAYIRRQLENLVEDMTLSECRASRAGNIMHLRTDITFRPKEGISAGVLADRLHPTPAVCGEPLLAARSAIRAAEATSRRYYAGFSGPYGCNGRTGLFVSLRCMELLPKKAVLYAGGGLLAASREDDEWEETCRKLWPMRELFDDVGGHGA